jgi:hypothetical protein
METAVCVVFAGRYVDEDDWNTSLVVEAGVYGSEHVQSTEARKDILPWSSGNGRSFLSNRKVQRSTVGTSMGE